MPKKVFPLLVAVALFGCEPIQPGPRPENGVVPVDTVAADTTAADSVPADTAQPAEADTLDLAPVEPAQVACENSVLVNGIPALPGANYVTVEKLPRQLKIEFVDCPHPEAVVRDNYVRTGYGSGEIWVSLRVRRGGTQATPRFFLVNNGSELESGHKFIITDTTGRLQKAITRPGGWGYPQIITGVATEPAKGVWNLGLRGFSAGDPGPVELKVNVFHSEIQENGRIGTRALVIRETEPDQ